MRPGARLSAAVLTGALVATALVATSSASEASAATPGLPSAAVAPPSVRVKTIMSGLSNPWDIAFLPDGSMLVDSRPGTLALRTRGGVVASVAIDQSDVLVDGERGMLGLEVDPGFARNSTFYTCQTFVGSATEAADVRVVRWQLSGDRRSAQRVGAPVVSGIPVGPIHAGCRLRFATDGSLFVGTGDAAQGTAPQDLQSLGGKVLRVRTDGTAPATNPFAAQGGKAAYVWTYGHRNVQGLALRPGTNQLWNAEHGPDIDDEVNLDVRGGNYGWDPVPGYNQAVPMTDLVKFPGARVAAWSSADPTLATSGLTFLQGSAWGRWEGALAVGLLKDSGVLLLRLGGTKVVQVAQLAALDDTYGRIRAAQMGPNGHLYVTTSNGSNDKVLEVVPQG